ncbi:hypothetical protein D9M68_996690 [compost metagenome]
MQLHLLQHLLRANDAARALFFWRKLSVAAQRPKHLPALTLQLAKQLGQRRDLQGVAELAQFLRQRYPEEQQTQQLSLLQQHLAR